MNRKRTSLFVFGAAAAFATIWTASIAWQTSGTDAAAFTDRNPNPHAQTAECSAAERLFSRGMEYDSGYAIARDPAKAMEWYLKAAEMNHPVAQLFVAGAYRRGEGVTKSSELAVRWYGRAAANGDVTSQRILGQMLLMGEGVHRNPTRAWDWLERAAEQGDTYAANTLYDMFYTGDGVPRDFAYSIDWLTKSAEYGDPWAQAKLGHHYRIGIGVPKDMIKAYTWTNLAGADSSDEGRAQSARLVRDDMEKEMSPDQLAEAQRLSAAFLPKPKPNPEVK